MIRFETGDGIVLAGDLLVPAQVRAAAIVCHPHPQFGGNRFNPVVDALFTALADNGVAALRFDFRAAFDDGRGERLDAEAALAELRRRSPDVAHLAVGYSFGAMIALSLDDAELVGKVLVAPPLGHAATSSNGLTPTLVLTPAHDQFAPPDVAEPIVASWTSADFEVVESVDHFLVGRADVVANRAASWINRRLDALDLVD